MTRRAVASTALSVALVLAAGGCVTYTHAHGTTFCGTHINTGAVSMGFEPLDASRPAPLPAAPAASELPAALPADEQPGAAVYVKTSPDCGTGAVVVVRPVDDARLLLSVPAKDGKTAGIVLVRITSPVTVAAWVSGRYQGSLVVGRPGSGSS
jgi:hypothetical protein